MTTIPVFDVSEVTYPVARQIYRAAWLEYRKTTDDVRRRELEFVMDTIQPRCTKSGRPGWEWDQFVDTLPGFREFWTKSVASLNSKSGRRS